MKVVSKKICMSALIIGMSGGAYAQAGGGVTDGATHWPRRRDSRGVRTAARQSVRAPIALSHGLWHTIGHDR
jgi:hypothetical protein